MGSWNATCALSNLPILPGEEVVQLILTKDPHDDGSSLGCGPFDFWFPRTLPMFGAYADYGKVELPKSEDVFVSQLLNQFRVDGVDTDFKSWAELQDAFHEGKVRVDGNHLSNKSLLHRIKYMKERGWEPEPGQEKDQEPKEVKLSPCVGIMIRKDMWDSLLKMSIPYYHSKEVLSLRNLLKEAKAIIEEVKEFKTKNPSDSWNRAVHLISCEKKPNHEGVILYTLTRPGLGNKTPSFQFGPEEQVFSLMEGSKASEKEILTRYAKLLLISKILSSTRKTWAPTTGSGRQDADWAVSFEYVLRCAAVARNVRAEQLEDEIKDFTNLEPSIYSKSGVKRAIQEKLRFKKCVDMLQDDQ